MRISDWSSDVCSSDLLFFLLTDNDADPAERLQNTRRLAATAGVKALHGQALTDRGFRDHPCVNIQIVVIFRVGNSRSQNLPHVNRHRFFRKSENKDRKSTSLKYSHSLAPRKPSS